MTETSIAPAKAGTPNLNKALSQLQGELPKVTKTKEGKVEGESKNSGKSFSYTYKYADLADVVAEVGPLLAKFGLAFHCAPTIDPANRNMMILAWSLLHESGEEKTGEWPLGPVSQKPQTLGSMITYGRRYSFSAAINIVVEDDDDGQRAQNDHGSRQSAGDVWENAKPAPARQNGGGAGGGEYAASPVKPVATSEEVDPDAQKLADEAHKATAPREMEDIRRRARETGKNSKHVRNKASGKTGQLAIYLDWRSQHVNAAVQLAPDDSWAAKVEELDSPVAADAALDEVGRMLAAEEIDAERAQRIENAIIARFPDAVRVELAATA